MIFIFDIDGTIFDCPKGAKYEKAKPIEDIITLVNALYDNGHTIQIETGRGATIGLSKELIELTRKQLVDYGVKYHKLRFVSKPKEYLRIDDCSINSKDVWENEIIDKCLK